MQSCIYECHVMHHRFTPKAHRFVYRLFLLALDLDELPALHRRLRLFSVNRANLYSFRERDHFPVHEPAHNLSAFSVGPQVDCNVLSDNLSSALPPALTATLTPKPASEPTLACAAAPAPHLATAPSSPSAHCNVIRDNLVRSAKPADAAKATKAETPSHKTTASLKTRLLTQLTARGISLDGGRIVLVTLPRILGYLFNPVAFYFCYDRTGRPVAAIAEVTNTFHEIKPFFLGPETFQSDDGGFRLRVPKNFYVSPFSDVDVAFDFTLRPPGSRLAVQIDDFAGDARTLTTTLAGPRRPLTDAALASYLFKYPLLTLRVITLIHWHALRLWLKRVPWFAKAARPADQRDLYRPHTSLTRGQATAAAAHPNPFPESSKPLPQIVT